MRMAAKVLAIVLAAIMLVSCGPGGFETASTLQSHLASVEAIPEGEYAVTDVEAKEIGRISFIKEDTGAYLVRSPDGEQEARVYGPIGGYYLLELKNPAPDSKTYNVMIFTIDRSQRLSMADTGVNKQMANLLHERLGITPASDEQVMRLTDNTSINLVLFQELLVRYRDAIGFNYFLDPVD